MDNQCRFWTTLCFLGSLVLGIISHLKHIKYLVQKDDINWFEQSCYCSNKRFGNLEPQFMFRPSGKEAGPDWAVARNAQFLQAHVPARRKSGLA